MLADGTNYFLLITTLQKLNLYGILLNFPYTAFDCTKPIKHLN